MLFCILTAVVNIFLILFVSTVLQKVQQRLFHFICDFCTQKVSSKRVGYEHLKGLPFYNV